MPADGSPSRRARILDVVAQIVFAGALACALLGMSSCRWAFGLNFSQYTLGFNEGRLCATQWSQRVGPSLYGHQHLMAMSWRYDTQDIDDRVQTIARTVYVPLWVPVAAGFLFAETCWAVVAIRRRRRRRTDRCIACGYDRRGLAQGAPCPECGALTPSTAS
jgi:hypothetical protein